MVETNQQQFNQQDPQVCINEHVAKAINELLCQVKGVMGEEPTSLRVRLVFDVLKHHVWDKVKKVSVDNQIAENSSNSPCRLLDACSSAIQLLLVTLANHQIKEEQHIKILGVTDELIKKRNETMERINQEMGKIAADMGQSTGLNLNPTFFLLQPSTDD